MIAKKINTYPDSIELKDDMTRTILNVREVRANFKTCLPVLDGNIFVHVSDISHFKSEDIYCRMYTRCGKEYFITKAMKWVEHKLFKFGFYRIHKSYLINIGSIAQFSKEDGGYLVMDCGGTIPISRSKKSQISKLQELF